MWKLLLTTVFLFFASNSYAQTGGFGSLTDIPKIEEQDASPSGRFKKIKVPNGSLTSEGNGVFSLDMGGVGSDGCSSTIPDSPTDSCTQGQMACETGWFYACIASNTWERVAIASWTVIETVDFLLLEDGTFFLIEDGSKMVLE